MEVNMKKLSLFVAVGLLTSTVCAGISPAYSIDKSRTAVVAEATSATDVDTRNYEIMPLNFKGLQHLFSHQDPLVVKMFMTFEELTPVQTTIGDTNVIFSEWQEYDTDRLNMSIQVSNDFGEVNVDIIHELLSAFTKHSEWYNYHSGCLDRYEFSNGYVTVNASKDNSMVNIGLYLDGYAMDDYLSDKAVKYVVG